jgi:hypothetical protein
MSVKDEMSHRTSNQRIVCIFECTIAVADGDGCGKPDGYTGGANKKDSAGRAVGRVSVDRRLHPDARCGFGGGVSGGTQQGGECKDAKKTVRANERS